MQVLAVQQVASPPESCLFLDSPAMGASGGEEGAGAGALFLHVGAHHSDASPAAMRRCWMDLGSRMGRGSDCSGGPERILEV